MGKWATSTVSLAQCARAVPTRRAHPSDPPPPGRHPMLRLMPLVECWGGTMLNRSMLLKLLCAALVGCLLLPLGGMVYPYLDIPLLSFNLIEAVISATL